MSSYAILYRSGDDGHHLYRDLSNERLVISDHSNDNQYGDAGGPEGCDDGVLYVDWSRPVEFYKVLLQHRVYVLPLINSDGKKSTCLSRLEEVHRLEVLEDRRFK